MTITLNNLKAKLTLWQPNLFLEAKVSTTWTIPTDLSHGILTSNIAFILAKHLRKNPIIIATELSADLNQFLVEQNLDFEAKSVGAYINIVPNIAFYSKFIVDKNSLKDLVQPKTNKVMFEYIGANTAKQLHAGHMRNCNIGDSLRRVLSLKYDNLITDNHWGDWGINMGIIIWGWKNYSLNNYQNTQNNAQNNEWQNKPLIEKLTEIYVWSNAQKEVVDNWDEMVREEFLKLEQKDPVNYELWQTFIISTKKDLRTDLDLMRVPMHDIEQGESFYESDMAWLTEFMNKYSIWKIDGKARFFDFEELVEQWIGLDGELRKQVKNFGRAYLISSGGYTSYCYRDVAARLQWIRDYGTDIMITVTDKTQKHNFDQAFAIICYLFTLPEFVNAIPVNLETKLKSDLKWSNLVHIGYGFLKLPDGKMSSRKGNVLLLRDLFSEVTQQAKNTILSKSPGMSSQQADITAQKVALSAIKWNDLKQSYEQDITFDIAQVLNFVGNTGVYQLYTYARLNSVLQKLYANQPLKQSELLDQILILDPTSIYNAIEQEILKQMFILSEVLEQVCSKYQPHLICNYLYDLTNLINKWYNDVPILKDKERFVFFVLFINKIMKNLAFTLDLLGIEVVDEI